MTQRVLAYLLLGALICSAGTDSSETVNRPPRQLLSAPVIINGVFSLHAPVGHYAKRYAPYATIGFGGTVTTRTPLIDLCMAMEAGKLDPLAAGTRAVSALHASLEARLSPPLGTAVRPFVSLGLTNLALHAFPDTGAMNAVLIATWESEFGLCAATGARFDWRRFYATAQCSLERVFCSPHRFSTISLGLAAGVRL